MTTKSFIQTMTDGAEIYVNRWIPDVEPKAIIVISHGMAEHSLRYDRVASVFAENGFLVSAHDHRGHGKTAQLVENKGQVGFGYLADKNGFEKVRDDVDQIIAKLKTDFPDKKIILIGHSFGSFIAQNYIENYSSNVDLCILSGTRGPDSFTMNTSLIFSKILCLFGQKKRKLRLLDKLAFGSYNNKIESSRTNYDWLTKDNSVVDLYLLDQWCGFLMTTEFYYELARLLICSHKNKNIKKISSELPIFIISGSEDPVSNYGKTVNKLCSIYKTNGIKDVELKLYPNDRHELFNETDCEAVIKDCVNWINKHI